MKEEITKLAQTLSALDYVIVENDYSAALIAAAIIRMGKVKAKPIVVGKNPCQVFERVRGQHNCTIRVGLVGFGAYSEAALQSLAEYFKRTQTEVLYVADSSIRGIFQGDGRSLRSLNREGVPYSDWLNAMLFETVKTLGIQASYNELYDKLGLVPALLKVAGERDTSVFDGLKILTSVKDNTVAFELVARYIDDLVRNRLDACERSLEMDAIKVASVYSGKRTLLDSGVAIFEPSELCLLDVPRRRPVEEVFKAWCEFHTGFEDITGAVVMWRKKVSKLRSKLEVYDLPCEDDPDPNRADILLWFKAPKVLDLILVAQTLWQKTGLEFKTRSSFPLGKGDGQEVLYCLIPIGQYSLEGAKKLGEVLAQYLREKS